MFRATIAVLVALLPAHALGKCVLRHDTRPALNDTHAAIDRLFGDPYFYVYRGVDFAFSGNDNAALRDYETALRIDPDYGLAYKQRAYIYLRRNEFAKAEANVQTALCLHPDDSEIQHSLGDVFYYSGRHALALSQWGETCELAPDHDVRDWKERLAETGRFSGPIDGKCTKELIDAFAECAAERCQFATAF